VAVVTVGLKYCGGCTPRFDRVAFVQRLQTHFSGRVRFVPYNDERAGHILVVTGCQSACVDLAPFEGKIIHLVSSEDDFDALIQTLLSLNE
jgi:hypothetical protein